MKKNDARPADIYPGVATDKADNGKVTPKEVKDDVKNLNNNPRNCDMDMP